MGQTGIPGVSERCKEAETTRLREDQERHHDSVGWERLAGITIDRYRWGRKTLPGLARQHEENSRQKGKNSNSSATDD